jgi:hypothetical protein
MALAGPPNPRYSVGVQLMHEYKIGVQDIRLSRSHPVHDVMNDVRIAEEVVRVQDAKDFP